MTGFSTQSYVLGFLEAAWIPLRAVSQDRGAGTRFPQSMRWFRRSPGLWLWAATSEEENMLDPVFHAPYQLFNVQQML